MYLTEEEALKQPCIGPAGCGRWQYYDREANAKYHPGALTVAEPPPKQFCAGSACKIAWRWKARVVYTDPDMKDEPVGYCGLAGRPE